MRRFEERTDGVRPRPTFEGVDTPDPEGFGRHPDDGWQMVDPFPMSFTTRRALRAIADAMLPPPPAPRPPDILDRIEYQVGVTLACMPWVNAMGFKAMVRIVDLSPMWLGRSGDPLYLLPRTDADEILEVLASSRVQAITQIVMAMRGAILSTYFDQDEVHAVMDYEPIGFMRARIALRERLKRGEVATAEDMMGPHSEGLTP